MVVSDKKLKQGISKETNQEIHSNIDGFGVASQETSQEIDATSQEKNREINEKILQLIKENPRVSGKKMAESVGISESGVKYHLDKLRKNGKITHVGPTKKGYWKINNG